MFATNPRSAMLSRMAECAYRIGMVFGAEAERAEGLGKTIEWFNLFDRCFSAVRLSTALELRLGREARAPREAETDREALSDRPDPPETERPERYDERDRERDRETERASFPLLIRTLDGIVADAAALPGPEPADLPTLRDLLARVKSAPATARVAPSRRSQLNGAAATPLPSTRHLASNVGQILAARRATGPPS